MVGDSRKPTDPTQRKLDEILDRALRDTFPASDAVAVITPAPTLPEDDILSGKDKTKKPS